MGNLGSVNKLQDPVYPYGFTYSLCLWFHLSQYSRWHMQQNTTNPCWFFSAACEWGFPIHIYTLGQIYYINCTRIQAQIAPKNWHTRLAPHLLCVLDAYPPRFTCDIMYQTFSSIIGVNQEGGIKLDETKDAPNLSYIASLSDTFGAFLHCLVYVHTASWKHKKLHENLVLHGFQWE